jgi:DNA-binding LytR/AlgR family response regulator
MEQKLPPQQFMRVHRSYIINVEGIQKLESDGLSGFDITMKDGNVVRASRSYAHKVKKYIV